jgi:hypothetical protein
MALCSIGELAVTLGVLVPTLRRWHREGKLEPACRTVGGHRRYCRRATGAVRHPGVRMDDRSVRGKGPTGPSPGRSTARLPSLAKSSVKI